MRRSILTLFLGSTALAAAAVPATSQAQQAGSAECDRLVVALEKHAPPSPPVTLDQARGWQRDNDQQACRDANQRLAAAAPAAQGQPAAPGQEGNRIVVQEPAPTVRVEQAAPQVTVQQAQPQVTVRQRQPEILVRQPAPTVTVDIPQPEITVRMPPPEVSVAQAQPQVQVNQPQPQVQVVQPEKPQVQVQPAQPRVNVQQAANAQPDVQVEGGQQPQVRYERAEPKVVVNRAQGQPQVHVEQTQAGQEGTPPTAAPAPEQTAAVQPPAGRSEQPGRAAQAGAPAPVRVSQLLNMNVLDVNGRKIGDVNRVVQGPGGRPQAVVGVGGFLGLGERDVAFPLDDLALRDDRELVVRKLNEQELRAMPAFNERNARDLGRDQTAQVQRFQQ